MGEPVHIKFIIPKVMADITRQYLKQNKSCYKLGAPTGGEVSGDQPFLAKGRSNPQEKVGCTDGEPTARRWTS